MRNEATGGAPARRPALAAEGKLGLHLPLIVGPATRAGSAETRRRATPASL